MMTYADRIMAGAITAHRVGAQDDTSVHDTTSGGVHFWIDPHKMSLRSLYGHLCDMGQVADGNCARCRGCAFGAEYIEREKSPTNHPKIAKLRERRMQNGR